MADKSSAFKMNFDVEAQSLNKIEKASVRRLLRDLKPYFVRIILFATVASLFAFTFVRVPRLLGQVIDVFVSAIVSSVIKGKTDFDVSAISEIMPSVIIIFLLDTVFAVLKGLISTDISSHYSDFLRKRVFRKTGNIPVSYFDFYSKEYVHSISTEKIDTVSQSLNLLLSRFFASLILVTAIVITLFQTDVIIGILSCGFIIAAYASDFLISYFSKRSLNEKHVKACTTSTDELYRNLVSVRLSGRAEKTVQSIISDEETLASETGKGRFFAFIEGNISSLLTGLFLVLTVTLEYRRVGDSVITLGTLLSLVIFILKLSEPLSQITSVRQSAGALLSASDFVLDYISQPDENDETKTACVSEAADIEIRNITFRYFGGAEPVFRNFSASIPKSGITVLSGPTGNGKTTLMKLVLGLYRPEEGEICIGETDISDLNLINYRSLFSVISQEATLFERSIEENICYPDEKADTERLHYAAKLSGAYEFIEKLEKGFCTVFSPKPQNISDGQIQLILLARALYHEKQFIVLDESTSYIDTESEKKIYDALKEISENRCVIIITHRKTGLGYADKVIEI